MRQPHIRSCKNCGATWQIAKNKYRSEFCSDCRERRLDSIRVITIGDVRRLLSLRGRHPSWLHAYVRERARTTHRTERLRASCEVCGYSKHVEVCHVVALSTFPDSTPLVEVNARSNIRFLCPNHHWEFDHGLL